MTGGGIFENTQLATGFYSTAYTIEKFRFTAEVVQVKQKERRPGNQMPMQD